MEIPEQHFDWDIYPDVSTVSSNPSYGAFKLHQSLSKNPGVYTLPNFDAEDKDEFFIYGTCVSVRGEQSESRPEYTNEPINDTPLNASTAVEESYESKISELQRQIKKLEEEASQVPILQNNLRYLYEENMLLHQKEEIKESHRIQNGIHSDSTDEEVEEIVEEEVRTYKKAPKADPVISDTANAKHLNLDTKVIDRSQFPPEYWSRLESYFYKQFLSDRPITRTISTQLSEATKRTTATMASPLAPSKFRCVGVSVCPSSQEVGVNCSKPETREFGCLYYETESVIKEWLDRTFPNLEDRYKKIILKVIRNFYQNREEFVSFLLSIMKKSVCHVSSQAQIITQSRGCSPFENETKESVLDAGLLSHSPQPQVSQYVQAIPVSNSRCTMTKRSSGINVGCLTESPVLRSQGTLPKKDLRSFTTCGVQVEVSSEMVHRGSDPIFSELRRVGSSTQTPEWTTSSVKPEQSKPPTEKQNKKDIVIKSQKLTEYFEKVDQFSGNQELNDSNSSVCATRCDSPKLSGTMISLSKWPSSTSSHSESYTISTERRMVDELSQRYLLMDKINIDEISSGGQAAFQEAMTKSVDLGSTHVVKEYQPTVEIFHHVGDETEEVDSSTLPNEILSPFRVTSPSGIRTTPDIIHSKPDPRVLHTTSLSDPLNSSASVPAVVIPVIYGQTAKLPESVQDLPHLESYNPVLLAQKPTAVSWIPVRNHRFALSNELKTACESLIGYYQAEKTVGREEEMKEKFLTVVKVWFELAAASQTDLLSIEDFIAILHGYSPALLRDIIQSIDENDSTCLHYSVGHGAWQVVNLILDTGHAHPDHLNRSGFSPIMIATLTNVSDPIALKTISRLFSMGDTNLRTKTPARQSPLMLAALHGAVDICSLLIAHGADINAQDASGNTALMYAIEQGHINVIKCLIGYADLDLTLVDNNGKNALDVAKSKNDSEILDFIQSIYQASSSKVTSEFSPGVRTRTE
uniref:ANK_REP_REGION domain-containing protein n=1 Tax=Trichobilharzia regenti TaxID=157069 RepID=A0AA85JDF8_TRIRE|nr:unnamed protein product [Trichobilharzia regenti]